MNPRTVCLCHPMVFMISEMVAPLFRRSISITWAVLLPSRGPVAAGAFAAFLAWGALWAAVAFLPAWPCNGAPLAACAPALPFFPPFGFAGAASDLAADGSCAAIWLSVATRSQILLAAVLGSFSDFTGFTPGKLLYVATQRCAGQLASSSASSFWSVNKSNGVVLAAAAASAVANTVMLVSLSMVQIGIFVLLSAALCAVNTWITPHGWKGKAVLHEIDDAEQTA